MNNTNNLVEKITNVICSFASGNATLALLSDPSMPNEIQTHTMLQQLVPLYLGAPSSSSVDCQALVATFCNTAAVHSLVNVSSLPTKPAKRQVQFVSNATMTIVLALCTLRLLQKHKFAANSQLFAQALQQSKYWQTGIFFATWESVVAGQTNKHVHAQVSNLMP